MIAFVWMLVGVLIIAAFTGSVASSLAAARIHDSTINPLHLYELRNGVLAGSDLAGMLELNGARTRSFDSLSDGLNALSRRQIDTFLGDRISLAYMLQHRDIEGVRLLPLRLQEFSLAFGIAQGSGLREPLNVALLEAIRSPEWRARLNFWLGASSTGSHLLQDSR